MSAETEARNLAETVRHDQHLGNQPLGDLVTVIEQMTEIDVAVLDTGPAEHGLTVRDPSRDVVFIAVARTQNPMRQRSTLAHELAHVLFKDWVDASATTWDERNPAEIRADTFARHFLLPIAGLKHFLKDRSEVDQSTLSDVVQRFLVSPAIAAIALQQTKYISMSTKEAWMTLSAQSLSIRFGWHDQYQALQLDSNTRRAPQRLLTRAINGYVEGIVTVETLARLRGINTDAMEAELEEVGIVPREQNISWADRNDLPAIEVDLDVLEETDEDPIR